jgi:hypothetical protein
VRGSAEVGRAFALERGHTLTHIGATKAHELYSDRWLGFPEGELAEMIEAAGFQDVETSVVDRETKPPRLQTLVATAVAAR